MDNNGQCTIHRKCSLSIGQGRLVNGHRPSHRNPSMSVSYDDMRRENESESENDRIRNRIDSDAYNDMLDIMEWEYTFRRRSRRCGIADCVTFYVVSIKFRSFFDYRFWPFEETSYLHVRRHRNPRTWRKRQRADTVEINELKGPQLSPISQISISQSTFCLIYMAVIGFWLHDRNIFNCFIAAFCSVCRMGGTGLTFDMIYISAIGQLHLVHDLHSLNWLIGISHIICISLIGSFYIFVHCLEFTRSD
jgi:hypothetical protein